MKEGGREKAGTALTDHCMQEVDWRLWGDEIDVWVLETAP